MIHPSVFPRQQLHPTISLYRNQQVDNDHRLGNRELWFGLCRSRYQQSRYAAAIEACNNVLILHSGHLDARLLVIKSLMGQELWQEAVTKAREAAGAERGNRDVHEVGRKLRACFQCNLC